VLAANAARIERIKHLAPARPTCLRAASFTGGYTGKSSGGPPGSITIRPGLDFILPIAAALEQMAAERKKR
jgi:hypothetical protein